MGINLQEIKEKELINVKKRRILNNLCSIVSIVKFYSTERGGKWHVGTIKYMLENSLYKGIAHYKNNIFKNKELALV